MANTAQRSYFTLTAPLKISVLWQVAGQEARRDREGVQHPLSTEEEPN